ncbi:hypothetical protein [Spongiimicrobium salis]|uniref:hypothetical protein n=1 Tax=Spongiimicrobium salis TaxID=1667022 RepID=UPI00374DA091
MMKKTILRTMMALAVMFAVACKNEPKATSTEEGKSEKTEQNSPTQQSKEETGEVEKTAHTPSFSNNDVQQYVNAYEKYMEAYRKAVENKDMTAFAALGTKGQELATMGQEIAGKLSIDKVKKYTDYMTAKAQELQDLSAKITQ